MRKRTMLVYGIALVVSLAAIGSGLLFVRSVRAECRDILERTKRDLRAKKAAGQLPPEMKNIDIDNLRLEEFGMQVTPSFQFRLEAKMWLEEFDFVWIPFVVLTCFGLAALVNWLWWAPAGGSP